jgi:hypothetical protein
MKVVIVVFLLGALAALGSAGFFMLSHKDTPGERDKRMARALAVRVAISVALFLLILFAYAMGWIQPHGIPIGT